MKYREFKNICREFPVISSAQLSIIAEKPEVLRPQLSRWQRKGLVVKLRRGLYILNENDRKIHPSRIFLANALYPHSYVSMEYALGYYDLIPERVVDVTSITTKKTAKFRNSFGTFIYRHLKNSLFFGFTNTPDENGFPVLIAEPEKALLDFIYLNLQDFHNADTDVFDLSYRLQNLDVLQKKKLRALSMRYGSKGVVDVTAKLLAFVREEG